MPSPFPYSPVVRECSWKKTQIEKKIVLSNQQLVNIYENNNLRLCGLQECFKKLDLAWGGCFLKHPVEIS